MLGAGKTTSASERELGSVVRRVGETVGSELPGTLKLLRYLADWLAFVVKRQVSAENHLDLLSHFFLLVVNTPDDTLAAIEGPQKHGGL
jgi:hypothetical protein